MKNVLAILIAAACVAVLSVSGNARQFSFSGTDTAGSSDEPFATVLSLSPDGSLRALSGTGLAPFVPIHLDQFVISLLNVSAEDDVFEEHEIPSLPRFQLNAGIQSENYLADPQSMFKEELFGSGSDSRDTSSSVVFVGVGFDFNSIYLKGNAYVGRPLDPLSNKLHSTQSPEYLENQGVDTDAYGFEASAGYQLNNMIAIGAGFGKMTNKNKETDQTEEVYAVYAQAILAVAPGVQVKPEVGKVDRIAEKADAEEIDQSFYAGAIWEINF